MSPGHLDLFRSALPLLSKCIADSLDCTLSQRQKFPNSSVLSQKVGNYLVMRFAYEILWRRARNSVNIMFFLIPRVRLENLMRFSKIEKKKVTQSVFKLFLKNWVSKGLLQHCTVAMTTVGKFQTPLKNCTLIDKSVSVAATNWRPDSLFARVATLLRWRRDRIL